MSSNISAEVKAIFEKRVKAQLDRHLSINPNTDPKKIVELTIRQEKERLKLKLEQLLESEESGEDDEIEELRLRYTINEFLPELERSLKGRY